MRYSLDRQRGATLAVSLIMLVLITLLAVSSFKLGNSNLQIAGNMQARKQALAAAQSAVEQVISNTKFTATPTDAIVNPCNGPNTVCTDISGGAGNDVTVVVKPICISIQPIAIAALNFSDPNDAGCLVGQSQDFGVANGASNNSLCANSIWDTQATATDTVTSATYVIDEGTAVRVPVSSTCP